MNWLSLLGEQTNENEAPEKFFWWSGLSVISASVKKNVFLDRHYYKLYPNIYVMLVAHSGAKKGVPINLAKQIMTAAQSGRVVSGRNSVQRVLKDLGTAYADANGSVVRRAQAILLSGELSAFFVKDPDAMTILTDIYDTHAYEKEWKNSLKGTGVDILYEPCITMLAATNEEHFGDAIAEKDIKGGFIARTHIVFSRETGKLNSLTEKPTKLPDIACLSNYIKELAKVRGEFKWTPEAKLDYDRWYYPYHQSKGHDPTGTVNRIGDHILKVAMLLSLARDFDLILKPQHIEEAIAVSLECFNGTKQVTLGQGKGSMAHAIRIVVKRLLSTPTHQLDRAQILQEFWGEFDVFELDRLTETLVGSGAVTVVKNGKSTTFKLNDKVLHQYGMLKKEIM